MVDRRRMLIEMLMGLRVVVVVLVVVVVMTRLLLQLLRDVPSLVPLPALVVFLAVRHHQHRLLLMGRLVKMVLLLLRVLVLVVWVVMML